MKYFSKIFQIIFQCEIFILHCWSLTIAALYRYFLLDLILTPEGHNYVSSFIQGILD